MPGGAVCSVRTQNAEQILVRHSKSSRAILSLCHVPQSPSPVPSPALTVAASLTQAGLLRTGSRQGEVAGSR